MKKTLFTILSVFLTVGMISVNAQTPIKYGVKADMNISNFLLKDMDDAKSTMRVGPSVGGFMKIDLHENFAIQPELSFFYKNNKMEEDGDKDTFKQWGMQLPVYALAQSENFMGRVYGGFGPYVGLGFDARFKDADVDLYKKVDGETPMTRWDFGLGFLLGYEFNNGLQINAGYQFGFINQLDAFKDDAKMRTQTVNVGIGYSF